MAHTWVSVEVASNRTGVSPGLLYQWIKKGRVTSHKSNGGVMLVSLEAVKAHREKSPPTIGRPRAMVGPTDPPDTTGETALELPGLLPATKQANRMAREAAVLCVYFPEGIPVEKYTDVLLFLAALRAVTM
jgi:excisionase family DNA binding protein